jgi:diguanylate cyclase (GGDEF)-like protein
VRHFEQGVSLNSSASTESTYEKAPPRPRWQRREAIYAIGLFVVAAATVLGVTAAAEQPFAGTNPDTVLFFLLYGLFTISIGYQHPNVGYYSFDRVSQVASILVLGPIPAAWVNGAASLLYPLHRLRRGTPFRDVFYASLHNAGLMSLIVLASGSLYTAIGGAVPLTLIDGSSVLRLILLVLSMQALNDLGMLATLHAGGRDTRGFFQGFAIALELGAGLTAVLVAVVYNTMDVQLLVLLLFVLSLGMAALRQFASMRLSLEQIVEERTETLRRKTLALEHLATRDNLTELFNRRHAENYIEQAILRARRSQVPFSIALCDIDLFKRINDNCSHAIGDDVLTRVADTLRGRCRQSDMIARYGGDEFLICFPDTPIDRARTLCNELRVAVEKQPWSRLGLDSDVTMSFGIAECGEDDTVSTLIDCADHRLYAAKNTGRNRVVG